MDTTMHIKNQIDFELQEIYMSEDLKKKIRHETIKPYSRRYISGIVAAFAIIILGGTTVFAGYYIYNRVMVNEEILPELDSMYYVQVNMLNLQADEYGVINEKVEGYENIQNELGIDLLNSLLSQNNPYMLGKIETDNTDFAIISFENYILGDTCNYNYLPNEDFYTYEHGKEYNSSVSLTIDIMLSEAQMKNGWDTDYLGGYEFKENYVSAQGYKVNLIEDTTGEKNVENYISEKCAVFVADGIRYTLKGRTSFENMKNIVDTMK